MWYCKMYTMTPPGSLIDRTVPQIHLITAYHIVDQVDILTNLSYPRGQYCRSSFKEITSLFIFWLLRLCKPKALEWFPGLQAGV